MLTVSSESSENKFEQLINDVSECRTCSRMDGCVRVLSWANGNIGAPMMFVGEAPGRLGADRTAIPFHGDKAGDNFESLLDIAGISRRDIFVTNAVLCNPKDEKGNNAPPSKNEINNCVEHLKSQIEIVNPSLVMTLGSVALEATRLIESHDLSLRDSVRTSNKWYNRLLLPLYHPGARAMIHRSFHNQVSDYYNIKETYSRLHKGSKTAKYRNIDDNSWNIVADILSKTKTITLFRLHKLLYLLDYMSIKRNNFAATKFFYIRQKDGPYCVDLGGRWYSRFSDKISIKKGPSLTINWRDASLFDEDCFELPATTRSLIDEVISSTEHLDDPRLKTRVYLTEPMKHYLTMEKQGISSLNRPLL